MGKWQRILYQPALPLKAGAARVTGSSEHIALSRKAAGEGMVLLKNEEDMLPLSAGTRVALFGKGSVDYVKGGGGSGEVTVAYVRNLYEGLKLKEEEEKIHIFHELSRFYEQEMQKQYAEGAMPGMSREPEVPAALVNAAKEYTDTAIITFSRFSGEGWDRKSQVNEDGYELYEDEVRQMELSAGIFEDGDYYLTKNERKLVETVQENFKNIIVVLNVGGVMDTTWFKDCKEIAAVLLAWQAGMEGGLAMADILCGDINPSGKLADTFAASLEDYPFVNDFHKSVQYVDYTEDIYVGYRYFETIQGAYEKVNYPFGFGLSYTDFTISSCKIMEKQGKIELQVLVSNIGKCAGKEVVQVYYQAPQGKLGKPVRELAAFSKTTELQPGESETLRISFAVSEMAAYDDLGKICESAYVLEEGDYCFYVGNSVRNTEKLSYVYSVEKTVIVEKLSRRVEPCLLSKRMLSDGSFENLPQRVICEEEGLPRQDKKTLEGYAPAIRGRDRISFAELGNPEIPKLLDVVNGKISLDEFLDAISDDDLIHLLGGQPNTGVANAFGIGNLPEYGIPAAMTADGPAGLRIAPACGICTTAFPCATLLACTWNTELVEQIGIAAAEEVKENNIAVWLAPAVNIHRNPICGRNFEYYSEDPFVAGKMGAAMVRGIQSLNIAACVKHFACNNKETNRKDSDSRVSERALREIYLKAFEIIVKEADPYVIMTSYNLINGVQASENKALITGILREEWGYKGMVTTDWWSHGEHYREIKAGNDLKMATGYSERVKEALDKGFISRKELAACAKRVLELILKLD
ncbi:MAG: glycoside hydrolase family 3 C-terminal domain-containing protein [Lachnospiraceae bacterium]|nr:glycoside hydrolase family 3 C-terminal domain-containing protein [Lachnospiraceae bacterium]